MINALNLIWIIPCSACFGFVMALLFVVSGHADNDRRVWEDDEEDYEEDEDIEDEDEENEEDDNEEDIVCQ